MRLLTCSRWLLRHSDCCHFEMGPAWLLRCCFVVSFMFWVVTKVFWVVAKVLTCVRRCHVVCRVPWVVAKALLCVC